MKKLSPLECMALAAMPEKARLARLAYLCRKDYEYGQPNSLQGARKVLEKIGEPRGAKIRLQRALRDEFAAQRWKESKRCRRREEFYDPRIGSGYRYDDTVYRYDPVSFRYCPYHYGEKETRVTAIVLCRFAEHREGLIPAPAHTASWWTSTAHNYNIKDAKISNGDYFMLVKPWQIWKDGRSIAGQYQWLAYKTKDTVGSVRVPKGVYNIKKAIESLKSSAVKKAEAKGASVAVDWANQAFLVQSPRRQKARSFAFKRHERNRAKS